MGDYKRLISYIYLYERGMKSKNAGFAKIESRNGICKVNISLRIADELMNEAEDNMLEVFFFYRDNGIVKKVFLERIRIVNGCSMIKMRMHSDNIGNKGISLDRITGIFICTNAFLNNVHNMNIIYASEWDDIPIDVNEFKNRSESAKIYEDAETEGAKLYKNEEPDKVTKQHEDSINAYDIKSEALENLVLDEYLQNRTEYYDNNMFNGENDNNQLSDERNTNQNRLSEENSDNRCVAETDKSRLNAEDDKSRLSEENGDNQSGEGHNKIQPFKENDNIEYEPEINPDDIDIESEVKSEVESKTEFKTELTDEAKIISEETEFEEDSKKCDNKLVNMLKEEQKNVEIEDTGNDDSTAGDYFRMLCNCYPKIRVNEINGECIKITPHDISYLPKKYWHLCNNSFLLHGFHNYKYLLLCEKKMDSGKKYLVGVPGVFHQKEQVIARMFGFTEFECNNSMNRQGNRAMRFGYWCMYL